MPTPNFTRVLRDLDKDQTLINAIHKVQRDGEFEPFDIRVSPATARPYDGRFHPSTHSTWTVRQLYLYLTQPDAIDNEVLTNSSVMAITRGHFWHEYLQTVLAKSGYLIEAEKPFYDKVFNRTGHMDGLLEIKGKSEGLEIKTINAMSLKKINDEASLKEKKFIYWSQAQEYLDVFELPVMRFLFLNPEYPFDMKEFPVAANPEHQQHRREVMTEALELAKEYPGPLTLSSEVPACCAPLSDTAKGCPMRIACPIGRMKK